MLFEGNYAPEGYDLSPDSQRFVMIKRMGEATPRRLDVTTEWFEDLRRRVSSGR